MKQLPMKEHLYHVHGPGTDSLFRESNTFFTPIESHPFHTSLSFMSIDLALIGRLDVNDPLSWALPQCILSFLDLFSINIILT